MSTRLDNLGVAREMKAEKKDAKAVKMATGWERGADGKEQTYEDGMFEQMVESGVLKRETTDLNAAQTGSPEGDGVPAFGVGSVIELEGHEYKLLRVDKEDDTVYLENVEGETELWSYSGICIAFNEGDARLIDNKNYVLTDNQGNPVNEDGTLKVEEVKSVDELTDEDFSAPTRNVQLPALPYNVDAAIGANGKPVIIKKNIFEKNWNAHRFPFEESRAILNAALYNTDLVGQTQPNNKPLHWVAIKIDDKSPIVVLEVNENKDNIEIVGWYTLDERNLNRIKRQAEKNGGELVMLSPMDKVESLSTPQTDLSSESKGTEQSSSVQVDVQENAPMPMRVVGKGKNAAQEEDWLATTPKRGHDYVFKESGLDAEEANAFVENKVAEAEKNLEKVKGKAPKMGTNIAAYKEAKADYEARVAEAQKAVDYWHAVKAERDKVLLEERRARKEKDKALYDEAVAQEEQRKAEMAQKAAEQEALGSNAVAPAIKEKWENAPKVDGGADEITLPNGEMVTGHYVLTESGAASASHQATNGFAETEGYPVDVNGETVNDRDYKRDAETQQVTRGMAADYDSRALQSPVVVSGDGVVLSGNGRTMAGEIAALNGSDAKYNAYLRGHAGKFGFTTEQVEGFEHPRVVFVPDGEMPYTAETFAKFNQREQKSQSRTEMAVKLGKVVDDALFGRVMDVIGRHESLAEFYADDAATASVVKELADAGVIPQTEMAQLFDGGRLSESGQAMVEGVLVGKVFQANPDAVRQITEVKSMRKAVMAALPEVVACHRLGGGYDLSKELAAAVDLVYKARKAGFKLGQHVSQHARQGNLFQLDDGATVADYNNAAVMMLADVMNDGRVTQLKKVLAFYNTQAADSAQGIGDMFAGGVKSKGEIINEVNELLNNGQEYDRRTPSVADGQGVGGEGGEQGDVAGPSHQGGAGSERGLSEAFDGLAAQLKTAEGEERKRVLGEMRDGIARFAEENGYPVPEFLLTREDFLAAVPEKDRAKYVEWLDDGAHMPAYYTKGKVYVYVEGCETFDKDVNETLAHEYTHADNAEFPENVNALTYALEDTHEVTRDELCEILREMSQGEHYDREAARLEAEGKDVNKMLADEVIAHAVARMVRDGEQVLDGITKNPTLQFIIKRAYKARENERQYNIRARENAERHDNASEGDNRGGSNNGANVEGESANGGVGRPVNGSEGGEVSSERGRSTVSEGKEVAAPSEDGAKVGVTDGEKSSATGDVVPSGEGDTPLLDVDGKPIVVKADDGKVELNLRTWQDEKQQVRDALLDGGLEPEAVDAMMAQAETIASGMSGLADKYPLFGAWQKVAATNRPILRNNAGGYLSFDYSFNCVKKDALNAVMEALVAEGKGGHLGVTQVEALKKVLQKHGFLTPCVMCYVEAKRKVYKQSKEMAAKWNAVAEAAGLTGEEMGAERELGAEQRNALAQLANGENLGSVKGYAEKGKYGIKKDTIVKIAKLMLDSAKLRGRMNYEWMMSPSSYTEMYNKFGDTGLMEFMSQGQSRGKALLETSPFSFKSVPRDLMMGIYNPVVLANMGGVRQFSYEDARAVMFFDYYTQFLVMQGARAPEHLYTKRPFMPEMFGRTGAMMNQSLIVDIWRGEEWHKKALGLSDKEYDAWLTAHAGFVPRGALPKGHTLYEAGSTELVPNWGVESFPVDIAMKNVHNKDYKGTVGNVVVAPNRKFILWALDNPDIHMVLAYHANGANPLVKSLTGYDRAEAMDDGYHTHDENGKVVDELSVPEIGLEIHDGDLQWNVLLRRNGYDARKAAQVYLDYCKEHGLTPMFCYDGVVDMSGERATSHPEYYKLLTDFRVYDEDGNSIRQRAVKALLPENWQVILDKYLQQESALGSKVGHIGLDEGLMKEINAVTRFASIESGERDTLTKLLTSIYGKDNVQVLATREFDAALDEVTERGHAQMLRDNGGTVYGFAVGDRIVLNEDLFNANTPMHEHTHVYMKVLKATNPRLYNRGMELWRDTPLWKQAKRGLEELGEEPTDEQIFSECMSQFTGAENEKVISEVTGITDKNWLQKAMSWLSEMWKGVKSAFSRWTQNDLDGLTAEQFGRMPLRAVYDAKERKAYAKMVKQVFGNGGAGEHGVEMMHEPSREETILRDVVIEHMKGSGLDVIGTEDGQRVLDMANDDGAKEHRVYHGSGAEFDHFDHSHMGEGEGAQAYGWGTYVTEVEGIGRTYAIQNSENAREHYVYSGDTHGLSEERINEILEVFLDAKPSEGHVVSEYNDALGWYSSKRDEYCQSLAKDASLLNPSDISIVVDKTRNLYTVEIPDDNGKNYLDWNAKVGVRLLNKVNSQLEQQGKRPINPELDKRYKFLDVNDLYRALSIRMAKDDATFNDDKAASEFLYSLGYVGIKYPADNLRGGRKDGAQNYVIFNENDAEITDHVRFFKTKNGEAYGFTVGGKIYYDPRIANAETPVHEYAHLWASALKANNAKEWKNVVDLMKGTNVWEEVKNTYPELETDDEIADEVLATYSGRRGAERLREEMRKAAAEGNGVMGKAEAVSALQRVKRAIDKFWKAVADFLHIHYTSAEEVADRVMKDLLDGVDPRKFMGDKAQKEKMRYQFMGEKGAGENVRDAEDYTAFASRYGVSEDMVKDYALGIKAGNLQKANFALTEIRRTMRVANRGMKLSEFGKLFRPVQKELAERYGDIEVLRQEYIDAEMRERGVMEAARKRAEEEAAKRKARADELRLLPAEELDRRYFEAVERGDDAAAREMLDEAARRKGYDDTESNYQGVGAWSAPSNPGYESDAARRADVEDNAPDVNVEDIALGYSLVDENYWHEPRKYMQTDATAVESVNAINDAMAAIRRGEKDVKVKVYRAVPTSVKEGKLRNGDWVTPSRAYAKMHGENRLEGDYRIIEDEVPVNELWWDGNDSREWGFDDGKGYKYKNVENSRKLNDLVTRDDAGEIIAPSKRFDENVEDVRYRTSEELGQEYGSRWIDEQTNEDGRHTTQVKNTLNSYKKFGDWVMRDSGGKKVDVLDASSGLGLGTEWLRKNGIDAEDVEPYPSENRTAPTYRNYDEVGKKYDYIISNAVLNVIPDDWRASVLHNMADKLKVGGKLVINVRSAESIRKQGKEGETRITLDDPSEILVLRPNGSIKAYQKGFTKAELKEWCEKELGKGYSVEIANNKNAGGSYDTAVVVTKNNESGTIGVASEAGRPRRSAQAVPNSGAKLSMVQELTNKIEKLSEDISEKGEMGAHEFLFNVAKAFGLEGNNLNKSFYKDLGNSIGIRISDHYANADNITKKNSNDEVYGLVVKLSPQRFKSKSDANYLEYVYYPDKLTGERQREIVEGLNKFLQTGDYMQLPAPDRVNRSGKFDVLIDGRETSPTAKHQAANDLARQMHVEGEVEVVTSTDGLTGRQAKAKGWYDVRTGRVTIVLPNNKNAADVRETVFHEVVAHKGLRNLVGEEHFNTFLDNVYNNAEEGIKQTIDEMAEKKYNGDKRKATEEYMAHLAEDGEYVKPENQGFFAKVRDFLTDLLRKVGIKLGFKLTDNDLRYILWRSWKGLAERDGGSVFEKAEDVKMQHELGQTDEARSASGENGIMFREGSDELKDVVEKMKADVERLHEGELDDLRSGARAIGGRLSELNKAMRLQRAYDMSTVASVTELAKTMLKNGLLSEMSDYDVRRLLSVVNNVHGKGDIRPYVQKVVDMMVGNRLRNVSKAFDKLLAMRGKKVDARGVEVQGELDLAGQRMADVVWKGIGMSDDDVADMCADAQDRMMSANGAEAAAAATDYAGWQIVMRLGLLPYYNNLLAEYLASYTNTLQLIDCQYFTQCKILQISLAHNLHTPHAATRYKHGRRILRHRGVEKSVAPTDCSTSLWRKIHRIHPNRLRGSGVGCVRCMQGSV